MRRYLSLMLVALFAIALTFGVVGCKKAEEAATDEAATEEAAPAADAAQEEAAPAAEEEGAAK